MSVSLLRLEADLNLSLASAVSVGATTATLSSAVNADGDTLISGKYGFTIDADDSAKEFIVCDLVGTALTNIQSINLQGVATSGFANYHRIGATVTITDWVIFQRIYNNLTGATGFDAGTQLVYDGTPANSDPLAIPTVQFVLDTASGAPVSINATVIAGDAGENITSGDWVYYNTTDGEWYKTDADDTSKCLGVQIGKARGAGTDGNAITGGIFVAGLETVGTYVAGTTYYIGNTAGELATSAGTNSVVVGVGDANGALILRKPTPSQVDASQGDGATPSLVNPFVTKVRTMTAGATINGATLPVPVYQNPADNEYYPCDANDTAMLKYQGFAVSDGTDGNPIRIQYTGVVDGFTGLDEGVSYWVSDTVGTIQNTPGTNSVLVGIAISPTQLLIQKGKRVASGTTTFDATATTTITTGFRVTNVRVFATSATSTEVAQSTGGWTSVGGNRSASFGVKHATSESGQAAVSTSLAWRVSQGDGTTLHSGTVGNITATTFDLINTEATGTRTIYVYWEAEGDI